MNKKAKRFVVFIVAVVAGAILLQIPAIMKIANQNYDNGTEKGLAALKSEIDAYVSREQKLPSKLSDLGKVSGYEYYVKGTNTFELCATFKEVGTSDFGRAYPADDMLNSGKAAPDKNQSSVLWPYTDFTSHPKGRHCFELTSSYGQPVKTMPPSKTPPGPTYCSGAPSITDQYCTY